MAYPIEILSIGGNLYTRIEKVVKTLNSEQDEFIFLLPPERVRNEGISFTRKEYSKSELFKFIEDYRTNVKGFRPYVIGLVDGYIEGNLFGSSKAKNGIAIYTIQGKRHLNSEYAYIAYYLIRYSLAFIEPNAKTHKDTRGCFFDYKGDKRDIKESVKTMGLCDEHMRQIQPHFTQEIYDSLILRLGKTVKNFEKFWLFYIVKFWFSQEKSPASKSNTPWVVISLLISLILSSLILYLTNSFDLSLTSFVILSLIMFFRNPKWRFFRLGSSMLGMAGLTTLPKIDSTLTLNLPDGWNLFWNLIIDQTIEVQIGLLISGTLFIIFDFVKNR